MGLAAITEALALIDLTGERCCEAEAHRVRGDLYCAQGRPTDAEASYHRSIAIARHQQARSWELRATVSLCRLWWQQGSREQAQIALSTLYRSFAEGFDSVDLRDAGELLGLLTG
jgi:adenylate cyclase